MYVFLEKNLKHSVVLMDLPCRLVWRQAAAPWGLKRAVSVAVQLSSAWPLELLKQTKCRHKNISEK